MDSPLQTTDYNKLNTALSRLTIAKEMLQKAQKAGLAMDEPIAAIEAQEYTIHELKRQFFPERS